MASPPFRLSWKKDLDKYLSMQEYGTLQEDITQESPRDVTKATHILFEFCWELAKKVGGIYTVLRSKALITSKIYEDRYTIVGPYNSKTQLTEFEFLEPTGNLAIVLRKLEADHNITTRFGRWLVKGYPKVILFDTDSSKHKLTEWRNSLNEFLNPTDVEANEAIIFGFQVALLLSELVKLCPDQQILAHFHEWMSSVGCILLKSWKVKIGTVFTTHATILGRYLSAAKIDFYKVIETVNVDKEAGERGIYARHWIEREAANCATTFTTISEITAHEAKFLLGKKADFLLPNGLQIEHFEALHAFQQLHAENKGVIFDFVRGHFAGHLNFDLDNTLFFFISGRFEVFNKGIDIFIEALSKLNEMLKQENSEVTVVGFIITNTETNGYNVESLKARQISRELKRTTEDIVEKMAARIFESLSKGNLVSSDKLLTEDDMVKMKSSVLHVTQRRGLPPIVTHNVINEKDEILDLIRKVNLINNDNDRVKIVYHPEFLTRLNPLIPLDYTQFVRGCHMGVFPSYYEPWGYTPAECTVLGVPSITSNLTGFANYMSRRIEDSEKHGIFVVDRQNRTYKETVVQTANIMWKFCQLTRRARIAMRNKTERLSALLSWSALNDYYQDARESTLKQVYSS